MRTWSDCVICIPSEIYDVRLKNLFDMHVPLKLCLILVLGDFFLKCSRMSFLGM